METDFLVEVGEFKGPLEVLLELVEKRRLHIHDIPLSEVADAFIEHMNSQESLPMGDSAEFILIASTLLLIKSKSLLPNLELSEEEEENIETLEKRLELYKKYRETAELVKKILGKSPFYFAQENKVKKVIFSPTPELNLQNIFSSMEAVLKNAPRLEVLPQVIVKKVLNLEEVIEKLSQRVQKGLKTSFKDFSSKDKGDKIEVIVSFLAMLELVKTGIIRVNQEKHFADIEMESENLGVPTY